VNERACYFQIAYSSAPAMVMRTLGAGSKYPFTTRDADGNFLDSSNSYKETNDDGSVDLYFGSEKPAGAPDSNVKGRNFLVALAHALQGILSILFSVKSKSSVSASLLLCVSVFWDFRKKRPIRPGIAS
jgi:hypothetical protein